MKELKSNTPEAQRIWRSVEALATSRAGWRKFECECGSCWELPTRDRHSPSGEDCPECGDWVFPVSSRADETLKKDKSGNLV